MPLNDLLKEVMKLKKIGKKTNILSDKEQKDIYNASDNKKLNHEIIRPLTAYGLGTKYGSAYFTRREAECMVLLLKGKTINSVANILKLSPRTVEYYMGAKPNLI
jgi:DNA-binding NarL/FixJ family response regulator